MAVGAQSNDQSLREQLRSLAATGGFAVEGLGFIGDDQTTRALGNDVVGRLRTLLHDYNYVVAYDAEGRITVIRILGLQQPPTKAPEGVAVVTTRKGSQHLVEATLVGPTGAWRKLPLNVDTGATNVDLPSSMASGLGFGDADRSAAGRQSTPGRTAATIRGLALAAVLTLGDPTPAPATTPPIAIRVQLGAFLIAENASAVWQRLRAAQPDLLGGLRPRVQRADRGERVFHLLQVGPLANTEVAKALCAALTARGVDCLVVKS